MGMKEAIEGKDLGPGEAEGGRRPTGADPGPRVAGPLGPGQRWSLRRKSEVALRALRGEPLELLSRELGIEAYRIAEWRDRALAGMEAGLRERDGDLQDEAHRDALRRIGELTMENELLYERARRLEGRTGPFAGKRSKR